MALSLPANRGFALLEVLVGLLLAGFGALGVAAGLTAALRLQHAAGVAQAAVALGADAGERLRSVPPASRLAEWAEWVREAEALVAGWPGRPWREGGAVDLAPVPEAATAGTWVLRLRWRDRAGDLPRSQALWLATGAAP